MSYWGKLVGGMAGFMMGGPMGAVVGAAFGHAADNGSVSLPFGASARAALSGGRDQAFAVAVTVLAAKLAKADGVVNRAEIDAFKLHFRIPAESVKDIGRLFDQARDSAEGYEPYATRLGELYMDNPAMLEDVMVALFAVGRADGPLKQSEVTFLMGVHRCLGLGKSSWERAREQIGARPPRETGPDPYAVLGVSRSATDREVRATWRDLMRKYHPDTLAGQEGGESMAKSAADKVARINTAWDRIKRERKL